MPQLLDYPRYALQLLSGERSFAERKCAATRASDVAPFLDLSRPRDILDLGNGRLRPQYTILRGQGHRVTGVDFVNRRARNWKDYAYLVARYLYLRRLATPASAAAPNRLICSDVGRLPFADASFDLATSVAAFEHFLEVPAVLAEVHRVLRPGGCVWVLVHLFTAPSGGHNLNFVGLADLPAGVEPWDHLRTRKLPFTVPLNEWRAQQYLDAFARRFTLEKHYCYVREGLDLLQTPEAAELIAAGYTAEELTCVAFVIVARK